MEQSQHIKMLYQKYLDNDYSEQELDELLEFFNHSAEHHDLSDMIKAELASTASNFQSQAAVKALLAELDETLFAEIEKRRAVVRPIKLWPRIAGIAAAVAAITLGVWLYNISNTPRHPELVSGPPLANDIAPGKNTATIKIGDGEAITLSDTKTGVIIGANGLKYNDGSALQGVNAKAEVLKQVQDDVGGKLMTVTTPRGGTYQVTLPDGTKVWLNAASVLTYTMPLKERGGIRKVQLSGEAYFEVFRNKNQPFVVTTKNLTTTVLGTHFNISAYEDEHTAKATLLEGSVKVNDVILKPSQQASVTGGTGIKVKEVNTDEAIAWKQGVFIFNSTPLDAVMRQVARWYNIDVVYENPELKAELMGGAVSRYDKVSRILKTLENTGVVKFKIEDRKVYVRK